MIFFYLWKIEEFVFMYFATRVPQPSSSDYLSKGMKTSAGGTVISWLLPNCLFDWGPSGWIYVLCWYSNCRYKRCHEVCKIAPFYIGVTSANSRCHYAPICWTSKGNVLFTWILCTGFYTCIATYIRSWIYLTIGLVFFMIPLGPTWANHVSRHAGPTTLHKVGEMILVRRCAFFPGSRSTV